MYSHSCDRHILCIAIVRTPMPLVLNAVLSSAHELGPYSHEPARLALECPQSVSLAPDVFMALGDSYRDNWQGSQICMVKRCTGGGGGEGKAHLVQG